MASPSIPWEPVLRKTVGIAPSWTSKAIPTLIKLQNPVWLQEYVAASKLALEQTGLYSHDLLKRISLLPPKFFADVFFLNHAPVSAVNRLAFRFVGLTKEKIKEQIGSGKGTLLGCSNFGCFYKSLIACNGIVQDLLIVLGEKPSQSTGLKERIEQISGMRIRLMTIESSSSIAIAKQLSRGGVVATMLDTYVNNAPKFVCDFMDRPAATPSGIYRIAEKSGASLLPLFNYRREHGTDIEVCEPINAGEVGAELAARTMGGIIESRIAESRING